MLGMAPDYDHLTVIQKVEVFRHAIDGTSGRHSLEHTIDFAVQISVCFAIETQSNVWWR